MDDVVVEDMVPPDAGAVAGLLTGSFDAPLHRYVAYCSGGVADYLAVLAGCPPSRRDQHLLVARPAGGGVIGFAEFRTLAGGDPFLSYVCVAPHVRGQRLAEDIIRAHLGAGRTGALELDVFAHNAAAQRLYGRLGARPTSQTSWWARDLPRPAGPGDGGALRVRDWHLTVAGLDRYGFGMMDVDWRGTRLRLGLPSPRVVRLSDPAAFADDDLLGAVGALVPTVEECLMTGRPGHAPPITGRRVLTSVRLRIPLPLPPVTP